MDVESPHPTDHTGPTLARNVMTANLISVGPDEPVRNIARLLLEHRISAVPVVDADGVPIGMVSEGDLIGRNEQDRVARSDWWLAVITGAQPLDDTFRTRLQGKDRVARDVMAAPLVTVSEDTGVGEVARLLAIHHIKRVPVLREGRIVGIVSRADLLRVVALAQPTADTPDKPAPVGFLRSLFGEYRRPAWEVVPLATQVAPSPPKRDETRIAADDFRHLAEDFRSDEAEHRDEARREAAQQRRQRARDLIDVHVFDVGWRQMLHRAREAAEHGQADYLLLRFPNLLCIDGGRAINIADHDWPATLRGEPAEIYLRWERELKPQGFRLSARVLEFPDGKPGDVGLFLSWAE